MLNLSRQPPRVKIITNFYVSQLSEKVLECDSVVCEVLLSAKLCWKISHSLAVPENYFPESLPRISCTLPKMTVSLSMCSSTWIG